MIVPSYLDYVVERDRHSLAKVSAIAAGALLGASSLFGQSLMDSRGTNPYAAASVRAAQAGGEFDDIQMLPDRMTITNATAKHLIEWAYQVKDYQVAGSPDWIGVNRYDIDIRETPSATQALQYSSGKQWMEHRRAEIQGVLADRFHLRLDQRTPDSSIYALVATGYEPKFSPDTDLVVIHSGVLMKDGVLTLDHASLNDFADVLSEKLGRPILNETGLKGSYDLDLQLPRDPETGNPPPDVHNPNSVAPSVVAAIQSAVVEQLGLKLEPRTGPVKTLVIETLDRPILN
jgi:uncharacterized protein (TIGR03435 family)